MWSVACWCPIRRPAAHRRQKVGGVRHVSLMPPATTTSRLPQRQLVPGKHPPPSLPDPHILFSVVAGTSLGSPAGKARLPRRRLPLTGRQHADPSATRRSGRARPRHRPAPPRWRRRPARTPWPPRVRPETPPIGVRAAPAINHLVHPRRLPGRSLPIGKGSSPTQEQPSSGGRHMENDVSNRAAASACCGGRGAARRQRRDPVQGSLPRSCRPGAGRRDPGPQPGRFPRFQRSGRRGRGSASCWARDGCWNWPG